MLRSSNSVLKTAHIHGVFRKSRCTLSLLEVRRMNSAQPLAVDEYNGEHSWQQTRYQTATMTPIPQEYEQLYFTSPTPEYKPTIRRDHVKPKIPQHLKNDIEIQEDQESTYISPNHLSYAGETEIPITSKLHIVKPNEDTPRGIWPVFRLMVSATPV